MDKFMPTIRLFKAVVKSIQGDSEITETGKRGLILSALRKGVLVSPQALDNRTSTECHWIVDDAVEEYGVDAVKVNSIFYKRFADVEERSELELRLDQLAHYMSTYGRGYNGTAGEIYEPEFLKHIDMDVNSDLVFIDVITIDELEEKIKNMLTSGIALSDETQSMLMQTIKDYKVKLDYVDQISNREFMCRLCEELGMIPENFDEFTRYLIYLATGSTLLIKSRDIVNKLGHLNNDWNNLNHYALLEKLFEQYVSTFGIEKVAKNITRYRNIYLVFRKHFTDKTLLNRALHLSKRMYEPRKQSPLEHVLDPDVSLDSIKRAMKNAPVYKLFKIYNAMLRTGQSDARYFKIRNGKSYLKVPKDETTTPLSGIKRFAKSLNYGLKALRSADVRKLIKDELVRRYDNWSNKAFYIPEGIDYAVPTTAKDFVGGLPYLTTYDFKGKDVSVGVAWDERDTDLDLHAISLGGDHYGWNSDYRGEVTYSGDMTNLNQYGYAAEFFKLSGHNVDDPMVVSLNDYRSNGKVKFDVFVTGNTIDKTSKQGVATQIDDKSVLFHAEISPDEKSKTLMLVLPTRDGFKIAFTGDNYGNQRVPQVDDSTKLMIDILRKNVINTFSFADLVDTLGGKVISTQSDVQGLKQQIIGSKKVSDVQLKAGSVYAKIDIKTPEFIDLSPDKVTASTFIDLLTESKEEK